MTHDEQKEQGLDEMENMGTVERYEYIDDVYLPKLQAQLDEAILLLRKANEILWTDEQLILRKEVREFLTKAGR